MSSSPSITPSLLTRALAARWPRLLLDVGWCVGFVALLVAVLVRSPSSLFGGGSVDLALVEGAQRQALYKGEHRIGTVLWRVQRLDRGWRVTHRFLVEPGPGGAAAADGQAARTVLNLRRDLSLAGLVVDADLIRLARISGGMGSVLLAGLKDLDRIAVRGDCSLETGECHLTGTVGRHRVSHNVSAGRGPVVTSAIYPLLARGSLGARAELRIFDPLSLSQRVVELRVEGRERLQLRSGSFEALRVARDLEGLVTRVWIDNEGRVLKEELPMGLVVEHEAWIESPEGAVP